MKNKKLLILLLPTTLAAASLIGVSVALSTSNLNDINNKPVDDNKEEIITKPEITKKSILVNNDSLNKIINFNFQNYSIEVFNWYFKNNISSAKDILISKLGENIDPKMIENVYASTENGLSKITITSSNEYVFEINNQNNNSLNIVNEGNKILLSGITFGDAINLNSNNNEIANKLVDLIVKNCIPNGTLTLAQANMNIQNQKENIRNLFSQNITIQNIKITENNLTITIDKELLTPTSCDIKFTSQGNIFGLNIPLPNTIYIYGLNLYKPTPILNTFAMRSSEIFPSTSLYSGNLSGSTTNSATLTSNGNSTNTELTITSYPTNKFFTIWLPNFTPQELFVNSNNIDLTNTTIEWVVTDKNWEIHDNSLSNIEKLTTNTTVELIVYIKDNLSNIIAESIITINFVLS